MVVPSWLESLLSTRFFSICAKHQDSSRNECNMYCLDCKNNAFCFYCRSSRHKDHPVIQIRRSSYHDVVRVSEIEKKMDISGIQTYVINSARVMFLNERPVAVQQPKNNNCSTSSSSSSKLPTTTHFCLVCARTLLDPLRFCSLGCKLVGLKRKGDESLMLSEKKISEEMQQQQQKGCQEEKRIYSYQTTLPPTHHNSSRRKGIPRRAPFAS